MNMFLLDVVSGDVAIMSLTCSMGFQSGEREVGKRIEYLGIDGVMFFCLFVLFYIFMLPVQDGC